jgi:hypothetical protein
MALYISNGRRLRRTIVTAVVVGVVCVLLGWLVGRQQVPSNDERVGDVKDEAANVATGIERLEIEYEQVLAGTDDLQTSVLTPIDDLRSDLQRAMDDAPWLSSSQRGPVLDAIAELRSAAQAGDPADAFHERAVAAAAAVRGLFALSP